MSLGSYILYLRAHKEGITPREVAQELEMPEHYIHAIELEKHAGDTESRTKLANYFDIPVEDFADYARSTHSRFMELLKKERRPQVGFLLMNGETLAGTVDGADSSIIKIVELNTGVKTILQRHAIKKWWPLKKGSSFGDSARSGGGGRKPGVTARWAAVAEDRWVIARWVAVAVVLVVVETGPWEIARWAATALTGLNRATNANRTRGGAIHSPERPDRPRGIRVF